MGVVTARLLFLSVLAVASVGCGDPPEGGPQSSPTEPPRVTQVELVCHADGRTELLTPEVDAAPDGVHVAVDNRAGEPVELVGLGTDFSEGRSTLVVTSAVPGRVGVACSPHSTHGSNEEPERVSLIIRDPDDVYRDPELECPEDLAMSSIHDHFGVGPGEQGDPVDLARDDIEGLRDSDVVERGGYPDAENATVRITRSGNTIATLGYSAAERGGWLWDGANICSGVGLREET